MKIIKAFALGVLLILATLIPRFSFAQTKTDTTDGRFHDDLLDHLVGNWDVTSVVHGSPFTISFEAAWVLNHQYLRIHFKSREIVPWLHTPFEAEMFLGYNHSSKRYIYHEMTVHGSDGLYEGFCYAYRTGNELKVVKKLGVSPDTINFQRFTWYPASGTWRMDSRLVIAGKEEDPFIDMKLVAEKPLSKKKKLISK